MKNKQKEVCIAISDPNQVEINEVNILIQSEIRFFEENYDLKEIEPALESKESKD